MSSSHRSCSQRDFHFSLWEGSSAMITSWCSVFYDSIGRFWIGALLQFSPLVQITHVSLWLPVFCSSYKHPTVQENSFNLYYTYSVSYKFLITYIKNRSPKATFLGFCKWYIIAFNLVFLWDSGLWMEWVYYSCAFTWESFSSIDLSFPPSIWFFFILYRYNLFCYVLLLKKEG